MSEKKTSTPKEIPLHEAVLKVMYAVNKERPALLTITEVYQEISDDSINEANVSDVLNWLVVQNQVERATGKYSLDRYSFLEERAKDLGTNKKKKSKKEEEVPLHEVILNLMYEANTDQPAMLTFDDVFWKVSDPKIQKDLIGDVLKWLQSQERIEYLSGKYSLDPIEFQDQKKVSEKQLATKQVEKKPKSTKKQAEDKVKDKPKIIIPGVTEEPKVESVLPKKKAEKVLPEKKVEKVLPKKKIEAVVPKKKVEVVFPEKEEVLKAKVEEIEPSRPKPMELNEKIKPKEVIKEPVRPKWRVPVLVASVICVVYTFYLLFSLNASMLSSDSNGSSEQIQSELLTTKVKLNEIADKGSSSQNDINFLKEKVRSLEELTQNESDLDQNSAPNQESNNLLTRLIFAFCLTLILIIFLLFGARNSSIGKKS